MTRESAGFSQPAPTTSRRGLLAGAGVLGTSALLVGCGTDPEPEIEAPPAPTPDPAPTTEAPQDSADQPEDDGDAPAADSLAAVADVPVGGGVVNVDADVVITQPTEGEWHAFSATCTHQGCPVTSVADGTINCDCHFSQFSATDGTVVGGPAPTPLERKAIAVDGDQIVWA